LKKTGRELKPAQAALTGMLRKLSCLSLLFVATHAIAEQIVLHQDNLQHIHFRRIQPTIVTFKEDTVHFDVKKSSSFLLLGFEEIKTVNTVAFEWKADGMLNKDSADQEKTRKGDDAWLRVGLVISGQPDRVPEALLPRWLKQVRNTLHHPSNKMIYLIPDARHAPGETWRNPYNSQIEMISVPSQQIDNGWKRASYQLVTPQHTVGLWIMADGDNTASIFSSQLRNLVIE
jgi:hypothetical protein